MFIIFRPQNYKKKSTYTTPHTTLLNKNPQTKKFTHHKPNPHHTFNI